MDVSHSLDTLSRLLIKEHVDDVLVLVHRPSAQNLGRWLVVISLRFQEVALASSGGSRNSAIEAYVAALSEMGENIIVERDRYESRCGIAGGVFSSQAILRAKCELLERDAFLHHYRTLEPFFLSRTQPVSPDVLAFQMKTADSRYYSSLVTNIACATGKSKCLLFGTATHLDPGVALAKAEHEYAVMYFNHQRHPEFCRALQLNPERVQSLMDRHHVASRDPQNLARFTALCANASEATTNNRHLSSEWRIKRLASPIRGIAFIRAEHPLLTKMTFGVPEPGESNLLHPFW